MAIQTEQIKIYFDNVNLLLTEYGYTLEPNNHANYAIAPNLNDVNGSTLPESGDKVAVVEVFASELEVNMVTFSLPTVN